MSEEQPLYRRFDDFMKIFYNILMVAMLALLSWTLTEVNNTSKSMIELKGNMNVINTHLEYIKAQIEGLPKKEDLQNVDNKVVALEKRVETLEGWITVLQRSPNNHSK